MLRWTPIARVAVATAMTLSYLAAAFVDCEPTLPFVPLPVGTAHAVPSAHAHAPADAHPMSGHGAHHAHSRPAEGGAEPAMHGGHDMPDARPRTAHPASRTHLTWKPTCLCGCAETRSQIGGGASRLGSVVPGESISWLVAMRAPRPVELDPPGWPDVSSPIEPIPI